MHRFNIPNAAGFEPNPCMALHRRARMPAMDNVEKKRGPQEAPFYWMARPERLLGASLRLALRAAAARRSAALLALPVELAQ